MTKENILKLLNAYRTDNLRLNENFSDDVIDTQMNNSLLENDLCMKYHIKCDFKNYWNPSYTTEQIFTFA